MLKESTARQIVQRTMDIIRYSVNVMDHNGVIIASGDPARIYQRHEGAVLALTENRIIEIDHIMASSFKGVKPGINLPIRFRQKNVGVIGISGKPSEVLNYAELVKMAAELIIEQTAMLEQKQWNQRYKEELCNQLIQEHSDNNSINAMAAYLGLNLALPRVVIIIEIIAPKPNTLREIMDYFDKNEHEYLLTMTTFNELILLKPITLRQEQWNLQQEKKSLQVLQSRFPQDLKTQMIIGGYFPEKNGIQRSYLTARATQVMANRMNIKSKHLFYSDYSLPALLGGLVEHWQAQELTQPWQILLSKDPKGILQQTIRQYFLQNCDLTQTAKQLHIHVNTLRYRLQQIEKINNIKINQLQDILWLYIGIQLTH